MSDQAYFQIREVVTDLLEPFKHWRGAIEHAVFAMLRRRIGCRVTSIVEDQLPAAVEAVEGRRQLIDALLRSYARVKEDVAARHDVICLGARRAFSDAPGTLEDFEQYLRERAEIATARAETRRVRAARRVAQREREAAQAMPADVAEVPPSAIVIDFQAYRNRRPMPRLESPRAAPHRGGPISAQEMYAMLMRPWNRCDD